MLLPPPRSTLFPYTTLFRSDPFVADNALRLNTIAWCLLALQLLHIAFGGMAGIMNAAGSNIEKLKGDRKSTRLNSSHTVISYAVFCLKKKKKKKKKQNKKRQ